MRMSIAYIYMLQAVIAESQELKRATSGEKQPSLVAESLALEEEQQMFKPDTIAEHREPSAALETKIGPAAD